MTNEEPKIIVDDDWKEQVRREKEQQGEQTDGERVQPEIPDASFGLLVTTLTTQTLSALGYIPHPDTGKSVLDRQLAKHLIDILGVLEEKTVGNLSEDESQLLIESLYQLRMAFVAGSNVDAAQDSGVAEQEPKIILP